MDTYDTLLALFGSYGGMYSAPLGLHTASPLPQCFSLEGLDRYLPSSCVSGCPRTSGVYSCVAVAFFGLGLKIYQGTRVSVTDKSRACRSVY